MNLRHVHPLHLRRSLFFRLSRLFPRLFQARSTPATLTYGSGAAMSHFVASDLIHQQIAHTGFYELELSRWITGLGKSSGGLLVDVGANVGYFSVLWLAARPSNSAWCVEPSPRNLELLQGNLAQPCFDQRFTVHPIALGHTEDTLKFDPGPDEQSGWGGIASESGPASFDVQVKRLDALVSDQETRIAVLKIDCEGADPWVIEGAEGLLRTHRIDHVVFEDNPTRAQLLGASNARAIKLLSDCGYRVEPLAANLPNEFHAWLP